MIDSRIKLTVQHDDNAIFTDYSNEAVDYQRDPFTLTLSSTEDYLYVGFDKPFNAFYVELDTANVNPNTLVAEIYVEGAWTSIDTHDETKGFERSGFVNWESSSMDSTEVNLVTKYYIRFRPSVDHSVTTVQGLNIVLSDDQMLVREFPEILDSSILPPGASSHINSHVSSREKIVQKLRNVGYNKTDNNGNKQQINVWDLLDIYEFKQASAFLTLSKIFFNLSDSPEDTWWAKYLEYMNEFERQFARATSTLDLDDDGIIDDSERSKPTRSIRMIK